MADLARPGVDHRVDLPTAAGVGQGAELDVRRRHGEDLRVIGQRQHRFGQPGAAVGFGSVDADRYDNRAAGRRIDIRWQTQGWIGAYRGDRQPSGRNRNGRHGNAGHDAVEQRDVGRIHAAANADVADDGGVEKLVGDVAAVERGRHP